MYTVIRKYEICMYIIDLFVHLCFAKSLKYLTVDIPFSFHTISDRGLITKSGVYLNRAFDDGSSTKQHNIRQTTRHGFINPSGSLYPSPRIKIERPMD